MKKLLLLFSLVFSIALVGCSSDNGVKDIPAEDIKAAIIESDLLTVQPIQELDYTEAPAFADVQDSISEGFALQAMMILDLQDIFVVKTDDVDAVTAALQNYKDVDLELFASGYGSEENATRVADSILDSRGNYVYFIAADNAEQIEAIILEMIE